ncbi:MAG: NUDIX hydrolase [Lachnospiraceae bacterium]|nr:NUDIX hydrolase [Lachnospiraceae bacterium]
MVNTTVAFCNEKISIYVAHVSGKGGEQELDEDEFINVIPYEVAELERMIYAGEIMDSKTVAAIMAYKNKYL